MRFTFYHNNFIENCIEDDEDLVDEIFFKRFVLFCTWEPDLACYFKDELGENGIEKLPEKIDYNKIRLNSKS